MSSEKKYISVVIPVYLCETCLEELVIRLEKVLRELTDKFEVIMVNDSSPDNSWMVIKQLANQYNFFRGIDFSRNFGQHNAISAGLDHSSGEWVVVMDCDLQDQPEEINKLYRKASEGYDVVFGKRLLRRDGFFKKLSSKVFHRVYGYFTDQQSDPSIANYGIYSRKVIDNFQFLREQNRMFPFFIKWLGFKTAEVAIDHSERRSGKTSYNLSRLVNLAADSIVSQSNKPLRLSIKFGFLLSILSIAYALYRVYRYFIFGVPVPGWTSVIVSIYFLSGVLLANMGILGLYIGKVFNETKKRPIYVVNEKVGFLKNELN